MPITKGALALGSAIIGGSGGGDTSDLKDLINDYAKGRIICDTSTMQVGDAVRVRSVTTNEYTDKTVTIVGGYLVFNVLCKDYYKICMLQGGGHQITITGYDSEDYVDINIFDGMIGTGLRVYSSITSGAPNDYNGTGINLYFDSNSNKWVLKSTGTIVYQNQKYTSGQTIEEWSGQVNISLEEIPTEIGGVYKTVDYGQTLFVDTLNKYTLAGVQALLNAHQESTELQIGDEVPITLNGETVTMLIGAINLYNSHEVRFVCKNSTSDNVSGYQIPNSYMWSNAPMQQYLDSLYSQIAEKDKQYIKQETRYAQYHNGSGWTYESYSPYIYTLNYKEVMGDNDTQHPQGVTRLQYPLLTTQVSRIRTPKNGGGAVNWGLSDFGHVSGGYNYEYAVNTTGGVSQYVGNPYSAVPCFTLRADS